MSDQTPKPYVREPRMISEEARAALERHPISSPAIRELLNSVAYLEEELWGVKTVVYDAVASKPVWFTRGYPRLSMIALEHRAVLQARIQQMEHEEWPREIVGEEGTRWEFQMPGDSQP